MPRASRFVASAVGALLLCSVPATAAVGDPTPPPVDPAGADLGLVERTTVVLATAKYTDVDVAVAAGYVPTEHCVPFQGHHYFNPDLVADPAIDPARPEALLYERQEDGTMKLVAVEYFKVDADGDTATADDRPSLFGHELQGPMPGHSLPAGEPPQPVHYDLHLWVYEDNPDGDLVMTNPGINCPDHH